MIQQIKDFSDAVQADLNTLGTDLTALGGQITTLNSTVTDLQAQIVALQGSQTLGADDIAALNTLKAGADAAVAQAQALVVPTAPTLPPTP